MEESLTWHAASNAIERESKPASLTTSDVQWYWPPHGHVANAAHSRRLLKDQPMATHHRIPEDTRQVMHLTQLEATSWLDDDLTTDSEAGECWGEDPAAAAERREAERGVNYFNQPIN